MKQDKFCEICKHKVAITRLNYLNMCLKCYYLELNAKRNKKQSKELKC